MIWELFEIGSLAPGKTPVFKKDIDPDAPIFRPLITVKEGVSFDHVPNARRFVNEAYTIDFVSLKALKKLLDNPAVTGVYEIDKPAYPLESIRQHYPKQPPKNKAPKPF